MLSLGGRVGQKETRKRQKWLPAFLRDKGPIRMTGMTGLVEKGYWTPALFISILFELHTTFQFESVFSKDVFILKR